MAVPMKVCVFCCAIIKDRGYRALSSKTSLEQYSYALECLNIHPTDASFACSFCTNKLNRVCKFNESKVPKVNQMKEERDKLLEDVSVLSHASLLNFSSFVNQHTIEQIALKLGVQKSVIHSIKTHVTSEVDGLREPIVVQNYHMLWSWRGRKATKKMVEQLLNVLRGINKWELAVVVSTAYKEHRRMRMSDFK